MKRISLRTSILAGFFCIIVLMSVSVFYFGFYIIKRYVFEETQIKVNTDLKTLRLVYEDQIKQVKMSFEMATPSSDLGALKKAAQLDFIQKIPLEKAKAMPCAIVQKALTDKRVVGGTGLISKAALVALGGDLYQKAAIELKPTRYAHPNSMKKLESAMAREYAKPFLDSDGNVVSVLYGGRLLNRNFELVDQIAETVFEKRIYDSKPVGTVTIFLDDTRIATNVLDEKGERAIGTIVSDIVYKKVVEEKERWTDRAFVVTDWYLTAYEPIRDIRGNIIGIFYVGILEKPFDDLQQQFFLAWVGMILVLGLIAVVLAFILSGFLMHSLTGVLNATRELAGGDLKSRVQVATMLREVHELTQSFNDMAAKLSERKERLAESNEKLTALNQNYLDMIGFVSHELKGILSSVIMNVFSVKEGYLGELNENQKRAMTAASKSLEHFENMVKNYLDLSHIEKGELRIQKEKTLLKESVLQPALEHFEKLRQEKNIHFEIRVSEGLQILADKSLLNIVCNNLLGNALKYGKEGGKIAVDVLEHSHEIELRFYNEGNPIPDSQKERLFKRFSRLPGSETVKGTGLGLFIVKAIVEKHGGKIWVEPQPGGNTFVLTLVKF